MRKQLSIFQIFTVSVALLLPLFDGMFTWGYNTYLPPIHGGKKQFGLRNLMLIQDIPPGSVVYRIFMISLFVMLLICVLTLLNRFDLSDRKVILAIPVLSIILFAVMVYCITGYSSSFKNNGEIFYIHISSNITVYLEYLLLVATAAIEWYKQFRCFD